MNCIFIHNKNKIVFSSFSCYITIQLVTKFGTFGALGPEKKSQRTFKTTHTTFLNQIYFHMSTDVLIFIALSFNLCDGWQFDSYCCKHTHTHTNTYHLSPFVPKVIFVAMKCHSITKRKLTECLMGTSSSWTWLHEVKKLKCRFKINKNQRNPFDLKIVILDSCELQHY